MRYYIDTEFLDRPSQPVQLISIGVVADTGAEFYAVSSEYDRGAVDSDPWLRENVLPHLLAPGEPAPMSQEDIAESLATFCESQDDGRGSEAWAWNGAYDFFLLSRLFGHRGGIPAAVPHRFLDLKQWALAVGNPSVPAQEEDAHHALADARHDRVVHAWLVEHEQKLRRRRTERIRTRLLSAIAVAGREAELPH